MDRFKFRVWDKFHNNFIFFDLTQGIALTEAEINKSEQSTGLSDKNGILIYQNDNFIIKGKLYTMTWDKSLCGFLLCSDGDWIYLKDININEYEIIGNIHSTNTDTKE